MKRILKYEIPVPAIDSTVSPVVLPQRAALMSVGVQGHKIMVWAMVDTEAEDRSYDFKVLGTGWIIADDQIDGYTFLGTVFMGALVWHVWVRR